jgi:hypothetical protein
VGMFLLTALPPLGIIGWASPFLSAGVLFPGTAWLGLMCPFGKGVCVSLAPSALGPWGQDGMFQPEDRAARFFPCRMRLIASMENLSGS